MTASELGRFRESRARGGQGVNGEHPRARLAAGRRTPSNREAQALIAQPTASRRRSTTKHSDRLRIIRPRPHRTRFDVIQGVAASNDRV
ncbi:hypothetical protein [Methylobacterium crusticola]|uniref:hypothetical protein n=1 Tax=Methylobacterium crusticola TaxID=1697972 RepID=UPI00193944E4|nr:hypothetical protein [Methylobacterium crusticola]